MAIPVLVEHNVSDDNNEGKSWAADCFVTCTAADRRLCLHCMQRQRPCTHSAREGGQTSSVLRLAHHAVSVQLHPVRDQRAMHPCLNLVTEGSLVWNITAPARSKHRSGSKRERLESSTERQSAAHARPESKTSTHGTKQHTLPLIVAIVPCTQ